MTKIAILVDGDQNYPLYREKDAYFIDFGGSLGRSEPFSYPSDTKAISRLGKMLRKLVSARKSAKSVSR